ETRPFVHGVASRSVGRCDRLVPGSFEPKTRKTRNASLDATTPCGRQNRKAENRGRRARFGLIDLNLFGADGRLVRSGPRVESEHPVQSRGVRLPGKLKASIRSGNG